MAKQPTRTKATPAKRPADMDIIGDTGLHRTGGYVTQEFLTDLRNEKGRRTFREMADNDATCGAILFAIQMLMRSTKWDVQPADDTPSAEEAKEFVEQCMHDMEHSWAGMISEIASMFVYGFAPMEIVLKIRRGPDEADKSYRSQFTDNKIGIRKIALRGQQTLVKWEFDEEGTAIAMVQQPPSRPMITIPMEKLLLFRTTEEMGNPEGRSILRNAYRAWYFKRRIEEIEAVGIERDLAGLPVARIPAQYFMKSASAEDKAVLQGWKDLVTNIRRDKQEGVLLPSTRDEKGEYIFDITLLNSGGSRSFDTTKIIDRKNREMATAVLADFIFLGQQAVGSFALSSDKTALFATALGAFLELIADVFNRDLLPLLWKVNAFDYDDMPTLVPRDFEQVDLGVIGTLLGAMSSAGAPIFPDDDLENALRERMGLPRAPEDRELHMPEMPALPGMTTPPGGKGPAMAQKPAAQGGGGKAAAKPKAKAKA